MSIIDGVCLKVQWYLGAGGWVGGVFQAHWPESTHYVKSLSTDPHLKHMALLGIFTKEGYDSGLHGNYNYKYILSVTNLSIKFADLPYFQDN